MTASKEQIVQVFKSAGYRLTRQREEVFAYLSASNGNHPSARQIHRDLSTSCRGMSVATVYNTMGTLVRLGLVRVIEFEAGDNRYEKNMEPHVNLICRSCGKIEDFEVGSEVHVKCALEKTGFRVSDCRMEYYGRCAGCAR